MEGLDRLVSESLARHGFDRPVDYRRLHWSRWFRCESHHSLLFVPSKPGVFALAHEIMDLGVPKDDVATGASPVPQSEASASLEDRTFRTASSALVEERPAEARRMLAVTQFFEDDDMAFVLDRMLSRHNPMRARLTSGRYFVRFVVIEDPSQRRSICSALNQWMASAAEKASGIGSHFASSLELTPATEFVPPINEAQPSLFDAASPRAVNANVANAHVGSAHVGTGASPVPRSEASGPMEPSIPADQPTPGKPSTRPDDRRFSAPSIAPQPPAALAAEGRHPAPHLNSGAATNIHCPPFPSGF